MESRRRHHSSSRLVRGESPGEGGEARETSRRRRGKSRQNRHNRSRLLALVFGFALFGVAGGLLTLLADDLEDGLPPPEPGVATAAPAAGVVAVPVVTCPGSEESTQHPAYAAACGNRAALKTLLLRPGAGDASDPRPEFAGRTALHHAAQRGDTAMLAALLAAGANPNQADAAGDTPLHLAATTRQLRHPEFTARRLIDGGARLDLRNARGLTPIEELETDHERLLEQQNLAGVLFQSASESQVSEASAEPAADGPEPKNEAVMEIDTKLGRVRLPVGPPASTEVVKTP